MIPLPTRSEKASKACVTIYQTKVTLFSLGLKRSETLVSRCWEQLTCQKLSKQNKRELKENSPQNFIQMNSGCLF